MEKAMARGERCLLAAMPAWKMSCLCEIFVATAKPERGARSCVYYTCCSSCDGADSASTGAGAAKSPWRGAEIEGVEREMGASRMFARP